MDPSSFTKTSFCGSEVDNITTNESKKYILNSLSLLCSNIKYNSRYAKVFNEQFSKNLNNHPKINLKYIYDIDNDLSKKLSDKFKCLSIKNPKTALEDKNIDSIFIATSTPTHIKFITEAAKYKKVIFCEKPLDLDLKKINKCKKNIKKFNPKIQMGFNRRYDPGHNSLKMHLKKGKIGKLEKIIITSRDPAPPPIRLLKQSGTIFKDMMIHDFDLSRFYLDKDELFQTIIKYSKNSIHPSSLIYWLSRDSLSRENQINLWLEPINFINQSVEFLLTTIRKSVVPVDQLAKNGFFTDKLDSKKNILLIRVALTSDHYFFPSISVGKQRFSIRFMTQNDENKFIPHKLDVEFFLSCCSM